MSSQDYQDPSNPNSAEIDSALEAMSVSELRDLIRDTLPWLDDLPRARIGNELIDRAAGNGSDWTPSGPNEKIVATILAFAKKAKDRGYADPRDVDGYLREASNAVLDRNYPAAIAIFRELLIPVSVAEIDLGQHELIDEVLGIDVADCAMKYVVSIYMTTEPDQRAEAVLAALGQMHSISCPQTPLHDMQNAATEPLPGFEEFLPRWRAALDKSAKTKQPSGWDSDEDSWRHEVIQRLNGTKGLGKHALSTQQGQDLRAWCDALSKSGDWQAALAACSKAAEIMTGESSWLGEFLDGAGLAAQELGHSDLPRRLERAWRADPSMLRLRRWLGTSKSKASTKKRAAQALLACPKTAQRQLALLHLVLGDYVSAAGLLATAPGLGWSRSDHPGHLLFPLFHTFLGGRGEDMSSRSGMFAAEGLDLEELEWLADTRDGPRLTALQIGGLLQVLDVGKCLGDAARKAMRDAMHKAANKRVAGVTENKRRRYYGHAASLVAACAEIDTTPAGTRWVAKIRTDFRRFPALRAEFNEYGVPRHAE